MSKNTLHINDKMPALLKAMSALVKSEVLVGGSPQRWGELLDIFVA